MGEIAEMMLDGTLCECCGAFIGASVGYPRYCSTKCANDRGVTEVHPARHNKTSCPQCSKRVKTIGLWQHIRDVHNTLAKGN